MNLNDIQLHGIGVGKKIEPGFIKKVQRGATASPNNATVDVTISEVSLANTFVNILNSDAYDNVYLHNSTTLKIRSHGTTTNYNIYWEVIELKGGD